MAKPDGGRLDVTLLRPVAWLVEAAVAEEGAAEDAEDEGDAQPASASEASREEAESASKLPPDDLDEESEAALADLLVESLVAPGARIHLTLSELGAAGLAEVLAVEPCPTIRSAPNENSRLITATFAHSSGKVLDLQVEGQAAPIGCTATHPSWSEDRQSFVPAGELRLGETLRTASGKFRKITLLNPRPTTEPVYNLEVDGEHVYYVSSSGLLVHNKCAVDGEAHGIPKHKKRINQIKNAMKKSGRYTKLYLNKAITTITKGKVKDLRRPDIVGVTKRGKLELIEVPHPKQSLPKLEDKMRSMKNGLGGRASPKSRVVPLEPPK